MIKQRWLLALVIGLVLALAACGGDNDQKEEQVEAGTDVPPLPAEWTPAPGEGPGPVTPDDAARPDPTNTPFVTPPEPIFQSAVELARADLSLRLSIAPDRIKVLESDASLYLNEPLECPALPEEEPPDVLYVYLQYERFIYPYQAYESPSMGMVVEACADVMEDQQVLFVPTPDARATLLDMIRADLEAREVDTVNGDFEVVQAMTWTDSALGCPAGPGEEVTPSMIAGYLMVYVVSGVSYEYHTDQTGARVEYCEPPAGYESVDDLIAALQENADLGVVVAEEETAAYNGLQAQGVLIVMTDEGYRVGLFGFDSETAARGAAQQIDDPVVSRIFVSGNVLIVQEENSPAVYSTLLKYAVEVRTPLLEEKAEPEASEEEISEPVEGEEIETTLPPTPSTP